MQRCMLYCHCRWTTSSSHRHQTSHPSSRMMSEVSPLSNNKQTFTLRMWKPTTANKTSLFMKTQTPCSSQRCFTQHSATLPSSTLLMAAWSYSAESICKHVVIKKHSDLPYENTKDHTVLSTISTKRGDWAELVTGGEQRLWQAGVRCCDWECALDKCCAWPWCVVVQKSADCVNI